MIKKALLSFSLISAVCLLLSSCENFTGTGSRPPETIRVACVGDSITRGTGIEGRLVNSYPSQLGGLLGKGWLVRNFGVNNATVLKRGFLPYWATQELVDALAFLPHVVVIKLGTNDARPWNWRYKNEYVRDYLALIGSFQALESRPRIWLCTLAPAYRGKDGGTDRVIQEEVIPRIREIGRKTGLPVIDLNTPLLGREDLFPDSVHPDERGARVIAETVYEAIVGEKRETKGR
ncbi:MAG TPA: GDSL-type esterase/lipase family protein [Nitrospirota bacterium]|nr:GDSL-type esterase/lipase family protein [Nitrospirota bacterium]